VPRCSLQGRSGARRPRHARAEVGAARDCGRLRSSHPLRCAPRRCCCQAGTGKQPPQTELESCPGVISTCAPSDISNGEKKCLFKPTAHGSRNSRNMQQSNSKIESKTIQSHRKEILETSFLFVSTAVRYRLEADTDEAADGWPRRVCQRIEPAAIAESARGISPRAAHITDPDLRLSRHPARATETKAAAAFRLRTNRR
jgi:hypothetical protein